MRITLRLHMDIMARTGAFAVATALTFGCGSAEPKSTDGSGDGTGRYLPLQVGNTWSYRVTDQESDETHVKTQTVEALEAVEGKPGTEAFRMRTESGDVDTVSWQEDTGVDILRHREESHDVGGNLVTVELYEPGKLRVDERPEHTAADATYTQTYTETSTDVTLGSTTTLTKEEQWLVEATDESVTVPAGTFTCLRLKRTGGPNDVVKTFYFARGVGKVKETGGQTEELMGHDVVEP